MNNRIKEIISAEHLSDGEFADYVGIKRSTLSHCLSGRNDVSKDVITKIHNAYPYISINWLMFGEGESGINSKFDNKADLFNSLPYSNTDTEAVPENRKETGLNNGINSPETIDNKMFISENELKNILLESKKENISEKRIEKIMVFYTDNTFEVFEK
ncbi:MAG: helix-turn-helix transcriptional regulator [Bacteroidales bacterium]|nr:helix-turn-helix transcriptional regulator [Bacteroidales bacterium]